MIMGMLFNTRALLRYKQIKTSQHYPSLCRAAIVAHAVQSLA